ncbi:MAG: efflux transporter outer membrane subunit, partial [Desulfoferrobacter sp.]
CINVGPNFSKPTAPVEKQWMESKDPRVSSRVPHDREWWQVFDDSVLTRLIDTAYQQNLQLQIAGVRVLQARAQLGIAIGQWYPQTQQSFGSITQNEIGSGVGFGAYGASGGGSSGSGSTGTRSSATNATVVSNSSLSYKLSQIGVTASWEMDFWGKFQRAIESAQMSLLSSVASYDSALVSLTADVASNYVTIRTLEERLCIAKENAEIQKESLEIVQVRFNSGETSERDVKQALSQLNSTLATIPQLQSDLQQSLNALSILLGRPPARLDDLISGPAVIPCAPLEVAVGIPIDLLRRRPDIRSAEFQAAAQSAQIGYAEADLYPAFSLSGTFEVLATNIGSASLSDMFSWKNRLATVGPSFRWNIFNYGRIINNVRLQDARFQELLITYRNLVLQAQQEVEDGLVSFLRAQEKTAYLTEAVAAAEGSVDLAMIQYREGATDYTTVLTAQQNLLTQQDSLASTQGQIPQSLISVYRALGGGWQIRLGQDFVSPDVQKEMAERSNWDNLLQRKRLPSPNLGERPILPPAPQW